jgi:hypothetical protein
MEIKTNNKVILFPRINKANKQINFQLKKSSLSKEFKDRLPQLKEIKVDLKDFKFEEI